MNTRNKMLLSLISIMLLVALCATLLPGCSGHTRASAAETNGIIPDEIILSFRSSASRQQIADYLSQLDATADDTLSDIGVYRLILPAPLPLAELKTLVEKFQKDDIVEKAHLNTVMEITPTSLDGYFCPNDPWEEDYWDTTVPGGNNWGLEAIDAPGAWRYLDRMTTVNVGLIETTIPNHLHPDLKGMFANRQCLIIDKHGYFDEVDPSTQKPGKHSTRVAGIMNAAFNNREGVSGIMGGKGKLYSYALVQEEMSDEQLYGGTLSAYTYLVIFKSLIEQDVQVINMSMGQNDICIAASLGSKPALDFFDRQVELMTDILTRIIEEREAQGKPDFVIVAAAGNLNHEEVLWDEDEYLHYRRDYKFGEAIKSAMGLTIENAVHVTAQAKYAQPLTAVEDPLIKDRVIVVGSVGIDTKNSTETSTVYRYSNFSHVGDRVDLVAPGEHIYGCTVNSYSTFGGTGTSFAAPHVSGVAGLVFACDPTLSGPQVKEILLSTATGSYQHGDSSSGMVNANLAVCKTLELLDQKTPVVDPVPDHTFTVHPEGDLSQESPLYYEYLRYGKFINHLENENILNAWSEQTVYNRYALRDLDSDGILELIIFHGYSGADGELQIFTITDDTVCYIGSIPCDGTGTALFFADHDNDFYVAGFDGYSLYALSYRIIFGTLTQLSEGYDIPHRWKQLEWTGYVS